MKEDKCPGCGQIHDDNEFDYNADFSFYGKEREKKYGDFFNDHDPERKATKMGTLIYLARAFDTMPEGKRVINQAVYLDFPNLKVQYLLEKPKQGYLCLQIGYKQYAGNVVPELAMAFYKEMQNLKKHYEKSEVVRVLYDDFYKLPDDEVQKELPKQNISPIKYVESVANSSVLLYTKINDSSGNTHTSNVASVEPKVNLLKEDPKQEEVKKPVIKTTPKDNSETKKESK